MVEGRPPSIAVAWCRALAATAIVTTMITVALLGCGSPPQPASGVSVLPRFAAGDFLPDAWIALPELDRLRATRGRHFVPSRLLALESGWSRPEAWGAFGLGERSELMLYLDRAGDRDLVIDCGLPEVPNPPPQAVEVTINGHGVGGFDVPDPGWRRIRLPVPASALRVGVNRVTLAWARVLRVGGSDRRPLALGVRRIGLVASGYEPAGDPAAEAPFAYKVDSARDAVFLIEPGRFLVPYDVPAGGARWRFDLHTRGWPEGPGERLRVHALTLDGVEHEVARFEAEGTASLDLDAFAGRRLTLIFSSHPPEGAHAEIRRPRADAVSDPPADSGRQARDGKPTAGKPPHVLLIILDALRRDHMGAYGYARGTTPRLDQLAREGVVIDNVVAECPYTSCSSPSILSGRPFTDHGVVGANQRVRDGLVTLAARLTEAGYRTVGFSGNPNNSQATGGNTGFDEFYETWRIFQRPEQDRERWHPEMLTDLVIGRLEQGFDGKPSFLMVHYVPPHEPYAPDPTFDRFTDPGYRGEISGQAAQARRIFRGELTVDEADRAQMIGLYDGNLLQADHHVGRLLDAYRDAGWWADTLVVVTSDHGEAFGEHDDVYGHNALLHRPMLDVPLIVRLPAGLAADDGPRDRFASLTSITPTIAGRLGLEPDPDADGVDLLGPARPDDGDRLAILRSAHADIPRWGVQGPRFKAIVRSRRMVELFDWRADPAEAENLARRHPQLWIAMVLRIEEAISESRGAAPSALSEEDRKMLEALGYAGG